jgi:hypothetical protein
MSLTKQRIIPAVGLLLFAGIILVGVGAVYAISVDDCKSIGIASCQIDALSAMCDKLFSNPAEICDTICRSIVGDDEKLGACVICCQNVKGQLDLED